MTRAEGRLFASVILACAAATAAAQSEEPEEIRVTEQRMAESHAALKSPAPLKDLPVAAEVLARAMIESATAPDFATALQTLTSSSVSPGDGGLFENIILRGFESTPFYRDGLNDSLGVLPLRDLANIESIEVLKGPNSALYGSGEPGGSINYETKKPQSTPYHALTLGLGNYERDRVEIDSTGPLAANGSVAYRLVGAIEDAGSFRDFVTTDRKFVAPSFEWAPNDALELLAAVEYIEQDSPFDTGVVAVNGEFRLPRRTFLGEPGVGRVGIKGLTTTLSGAYRMSDDWRWSAGVYWQDTDFDGYRVEPDELDEIDLSESTATLARELVRELVATNSVTAQLEIEGRFAVQGVDNRILIGYEFSGVDEDTEVEGSDPEEEPYEIDPFDIEYGQPRPELESVQSSIESIDTHSVYVQDFMTLSEHWRVLAGTRLDGVDMHGRDAISGVQFDQRATELSSRVGLVFTPNDAWSLFASFSESLDPNEGLTPDGNPLKPTRGRAVEGGFRVRHPFLGFALDASLFRIKQTNVPRDAPGAPGFEVQTAEQVSKGVDVEVSIRPADSIYAGIKYAYLDAEIMRDLDIPDGTGPLNAPRHKLVAFAFVSLTALRADDVRIGAQLVHVSKRQASLDPGEDLSIRLPAYMTVAVFASYALSRHIELRLDASNLFGENYFAGSQSDLLHLNPGAPLMVFGSVKLQF
jgi:iron complex outermembrane receptor protein